MHKHRDNLELLQQAAEIIGFEYKIIENNIHVQVAADGEFFYKIWNPIDNDGDCASMETACWIEFEWYATKVVAFTHDGFHQIREKYSNHSGNRQAARRLACTRVAAALGREKGPS